MPKPKPRHYGDVVDYYLARFRALSRDERNAVRHPQFFNKVLSEYEKGTTMPVKKTPKAVAAKSDDVLAAEAALGGELDSWKAQEAARITTLVTKPELTDAEEHEFAQIAAQRIEAKREEKRIKRRVAKWLTKHGNPVTTEENVEFLKVQLGMSGKRYRRQQEEELARLADDEAQEHARHVAAAQAARENRATPKPPAGATAPKAAAESTEAPPKRRRRPRPGFAGYVTLGGQIHDDDDDE
jgi:ATP-dependent Lon protease